MNETNAPASKPASAWQEVQTTLRQSPRIWLVTGAGGFIGSHLVESLLKLGQRVVALDNFSTGKIENLINVRTNAGANGQNLQVRVGDITNLDDCVSALMWDGNPVDYVLHQAALGSVPRSIVEPITTQQTNVNGFLNMLVAARDAGVQGFVYASSSAVYGDHPGLPKREWEIGAPLSPYALSKWMNEEWAANFAQVYGFRSIGLRYFNVFGARQDPNGPYAAVIPRWIENLLQGEDCTINGDGETTRDFYHVSNVVQANLLAATTQDPNAWSQSYNIGNGERTTLNELYVSLRDAVSRYNPNVASLAPIHAPFRAGDIRHSYADITKAQQLLGYFPEMSLTEGIQHTVDAYVQAAT